MVQGQRAVAALIYFLELGSGISQNGGPCATQIERPSSHVFYTRQCTHHAVICAGSKSHMAAVKPIAYCTS